MEMLTKEQVQRAIEVLKREDIAYVIENPVTKGESGLAFKTFAHWEWRPVLEAHPQLRDAFALVAMASFPPRQTDVGAFKRSFSEWLDFYESLPPDVLDTDPPLGPHALIRNLAYRMFRAAYDADDSTSVAGAWERLLSMMDNPPPVVQAAGSDAQALHNMLFGALVYPTLPESGEDAVLKRIADATEHLINALGTGLISAHDGWTFTLIAYPIEFLPIAHVFDSASAAPMTTGISRRYFTDLLRARMLYTTEWEQHWAYNKFAPFFDEGLTDLFARREFSQESLHTVLREGFGTLIDSSALKKLFEEIWKHRFSTTLYALMAVVSQEFPEHATRIVRLAASTVPDIDGALTFARLAQGWGADRELVGLVSEPMRNAANQILPMIYHRVSRKGILRSSDALQKHGELARHTASAVIGIETQYLKYDYPPQVWIDLWEGFCSLLTNPSELLKDPQKMAAFREARDRVFEDGLSDDLCGEEGMP
jgi:hypothetical protein